MTTALLWMLAPGCDAATPLDELQQAFQARHGHPSRSLQRASTWRPPEPYMPDAPDGWFLGPGGMTPLPGGGWTFFQSSPDLIGRAGAIDRPLLGVHRLDTVGDMLVGTTEAASCASTCFVVAGAEGIVRQGCGSEGPPDERCSVAGGQMFRMSGGPVEVVDLVTGASRSLPRPEGASGEASVSNGVVYWFWDGVARFYMGEGQLVEVGGRPEDVHPDGAVLFTRVTTDDSIGLRTSTGAVRRVGGRGCRSRFVDDQAIVACRTSLTWYDLEGRTVHETPSPYPDLRDGDRLPFLRTHPDGRSFSFGGSSYSRDASTTVPSWIRELELATPGPSPYRPMTRYRRLVDTAGRPVVGAWTQGERTDAEGLFRGHTEVQHVVIEGVAHPVVREREPAEHFVKLTEEGLANELRRIAEGRRATEVWVVRPPIPPLGVCEGGLFRITIGRPEQMTNPPYYSPDVVPHDTRTLAVFHVVNGTDQRFEARRGRFLAADVPLPGLVVRVETPGFAYVARTGPAGEVPLFGDVVAVSVDEGRELYPSWRPLEIEGDVLRLPL